MHVVAVGGRSFISGFRLAGIDGIEVDSSSDALKAVSHLMSEKDVGLVIVSDDVARSIRSELNAMRSKQPVPLIYEVPAPGSRQERMEYMDMLKQILGV